MKRVIAALALCLAFALPAQAEVSGVYMGLKVIDSIQNTGNVSQDNMTGPLGDISIDQYGQNTIGGGIFVGYDFYPTMQIPVRAELEYAIRSNMEETWDGKAFGRHSETKGQWNAQTLFANFYYDFHNSTAFTPYVGAGLGLAFVKSKYTVTDVASDRELDSMSEMNTNFAWNVGVGCSYAFNENVALDLGYRFVSLGHTEAETTSSLTGAKYTVETNPYANEFSLGLRVTF